MFAKMFRLASVSAATLGLLAGPAAAQNCPSCAMAPPIMAANPCMTCAAPAPPCQQLQPVVQPCYQTVPVTEYRPIKQTVQRPVCDVQYVDREVTAYRPITETKTCDVPTVSWQQVTECQTVQRDMGYWTTQYECRPRVSPCQYDPRPGVAGWWNRTNYSMRSAFTPQVVARRQYVPNVVAQQIPITRQVPQYGTRQVSYNVTRMEPYTTTQKVAVNSVRYVAEEVTQMQPVTVMRTVPIGSTVAWVNVPYGANATATALGPTPDPIGSRSADRFDERHPDKYKRDANTAPFPSDPVPARKLSAPVPRPIEGERHFPEARNESPREREIDLASNSEVRVPSIVRANRWSARSAPQSIDVRNEDSRESTDDLNVGPEITVARRVK